MRFSFRGEAFETRVWRPSAGRVGELVAMDTETEEILPGRVPRLVLAQAYGGGGVVYFVQAQALSRFIAAHRGATLVFHNAPFDLAVIQAAAGFDPGQALEARQVWDTAILFRLLGLATTGQVPHRWGLGAVAEELLGVELEKADGLRTGFGRHIGPDGVVSYYSITEEELLYAALDAIVCRQLYDILAPKLAALDPIDHLSHQVQLLGAIGLHHVELLGIGLDLPRRAGFLAGIEGKIARAKDVLGGFGYVPGRRGVAAVGEYRLAQFEQERALTLPRTPATGKLSTRFEDLQGYQHESPFIAALLEFKRLEKLKGFVVKLDQPRIHARFNVLVNTGRTSCSGPNLQNQPRAPGVRECFVPAGGHVFLIIDYAQIELCTLAQVCLDRFGASKMGELLNAGVDLHRWFAALLLGKDPAAVTPGERQTAKACNFGFPGGLSITAFLEYARGTYGITSLTEEEAKRYRERWIAAFPEMRRYLADDSLERLLKAHDFSSAPESLGFDCEPEMAAKMFIRIVGGNDLKTNGQPYSGRTMEWALGTVLPALDPLSPRHVSGSPEVRKRLLRSAAQTRTGRIRANCGYTEARNTPFQGLAADGAKVALYRLWQAGHRVVNFIHDEFIIEIPLDKDLERVGGEVEAILLESMRSVVPDIRIRSEWFFADRWYKGGKLTRDEAGHVIPYSVAAPDQSTAGLEAQI